MHHTSKLNNNLHLTTDDCDLDALLYRKEAHLGLQEEAFEIAICANHALRHSHCCSPRGSVIGTKTGLSFSSCSKHMFVWFNHLTYPSSPRGFKVTAFWWLQLPRASQLPTTAITSPANAQADFLPSETSKKLKEHRTKLGTMSTSLS